MLVLMLLQTVVKIVYYFLLPKFIDECNRLLTDSTWGSARMHVSLNNASTRTVRKCL